VSGPLGESVSTHVAGVRGGLRSFPAGRTAVERGPLDVEKTELGGEAARSGEASGLPVRGKHAVTGHQDREWIARQRLPDGARRSWRPGDCRHLAVCEGRPRWNGPRGFVDAPVEWWNAGHVECHGVNV
jgi:hypothetical protein